VLYKIGLLPQTYSNVQNTVLIMKKILLFSFLLFVILLPAQPSIQWQKSYGGSKDDGGSFIQQTSDGGYVAIGSTRSTDGDVPSGLHGLSDIWVIKTDELGNIQWQKLLGGNSFEEGFSIQQTSDGGYIFAGSTLSNNGDVSGNHGGWDCWVVKLSPTGTILWQRALGGSLEDRAYSLTLTTDGGCIMAGYSASNDGDVSGNHGSFDYWVVKLSDAGILEWQKTYGGTGDDEAYCIIQTNDGGYAVMGATFSNDDDVSDNNGTIDFWMLKIDNAGAIEWQRALGGSGADDGRLVIQTSDGGYLVGGREGSGNGQVVGDYDRTDFWIVKLSANGDFQWQKPLGGNAEDIPTGMLETSDGGYIINGITESTDGDVLDNDGIWDIWLVKVNGSGVVQWQKTIGGTQFDYPTNITPTSEGGFAIVGFSDSNDEEITGNHGKYDLFIIKLSAESSPTKETQTQPLEIYPNPASQSFSLNIPTEAATFNLTMTDLLGREVSRQAVFPNGGSVEIAQLPVGVYFVKAEESSGKVYVGKFRKE